MRAFIQQDGPSEHDPMEINVLTEPASLADRIAAQWFLDAPKRPGGERLILDPLWADGRPLTPFPHQRVVYQRVLREFPQSFLFCDEVGLGKTIEAGLALRALLLCGEVRRGLILTPRSLVRQWMEELREKCALTAWFYDGRLLHDVDGHIRQTHNPWDEEGIVLASRHLATRTDRMHHLLSAPRPWDVVIVDEAHAARRRVFGNQGPNHALTLLQSLRHRQRYRCLWLLTATPMQLEPYEVHDLLRLCGLDNPSWGGWSGLRGFQDFFESLRDFHRKRNVRGPVIELTRIAVTHGAPDFSKAHVPPAWTPFRWPILLRTSSRADRGCDWCCGISREHRQRRALPSLRVRHRLPFTCFVTHGRHCERTKSGAWCVVWQRARPRISRWNFTP